MLTPSTPARRATGRILIGALFCAALVMGCDGDPTTVGGGDGSVGNLDGAAGSEGGLAPKLDGGGTAQDAPVGPTPDSGGSSGPPGYGSVCRLGSSCPGSLECRSAQTIAAKGFCTKKCRLGADCSGAPGGSKAGCLLQNFGATTKYCAFLCKDGGGSYKCPSGMVCDTVPYVGTTDVFVCNPPA